MGVVIRPRGGSRPPPRMPCHFGGCPCSGLSWVHSPGRQNFGSAEARRRRGAEDTAVPPGGSPSVPRRVPRTATRSRAHQEAGRWPGTGVQGEDRGPGAVSPGPRAVRTGPGRGARLRRRRGRGGRSHGSPGPGAGRPPPSVTTRGRHRPAQRPARGPLLAAPRGSSRAERGVPVPSRSPGTRARRRSREPD